MTSLEDLITFNRKRIEFYNEEIARLERQPPKGKWITETKQDKMIAEFEAERRMVRDTVSYLEAFKKHGVRP